LATLHGEFLTRRKFAAPIAADRPARTYHFLGMDDFFIDFAGIKPERHPTRLALPAINAGDVVDIEERHHHVELVNKDGVSFARLSKKAQSELGGKLSTIKEVRVIAMVRRYWEDVVDKDFQGNCYGASWEFPIVELIC
jgi:ATP-dependent DNA helicase RecQ